jgi:hypothetical protein
MMARRRIARKIGAAMASAAVAAVLAGCGGTRLDLDPSDWFTRGDSRQVTGGEGGFTVSRGATETGPRAVTASDLVGPDGRCEGVAAEAAAAPRAVALTMTECELVAAAGAPEQVNLGASETGERRAVLTYTKGDHPGIYTFVSGRLKIIERAPTPAKPEPRRRAPKKKTKAAA